MLNVQRFVRPLAAAAILSFAVLPIASAANVTDGPVISNPSIEEGKLPKDAKGFSSKASGATMGKQSKPQTMGQVAVSDRCFVTRVDYCYMDSYAPVGSACICTDGYYYYNGVVY